MIVPAFKEDQASDRGPYALNLVCFGFGLLAEPRPSPSNGPQHHGSLGPRVLDLFPASHPISWGGRKIKGDPAFIPT